MTLLQHIGTLVAGLGLVSVLAALPEIMSYIRGAIRAL